MTDTTLDESPTDSSSTQPSPRGASAPPRQHEKDSGRPPGAETNPWAALGALLIGFFMILVDSTIVSVATETLVSKLDTSLNNVVWVTSAYLLAYAVPLLITGRLGDRFGPKNLYVAGLAVFTVASALCGFAPNITVLIVARLIQGLGAAMITPQTMAIITRIFPAERRGKAMGLWGSTAGVAALVGPILGGVLVDHAGWEWIFFVNVPVGVVGLFLAIKFVPQLENHGHKFDFVGVGLSAVALFCIVYGIQQGEQYDWGTITGIISVPLLIILGVVLFVGFIVWEHFYQGEALVPLSLFTNRNFSLASLAVAFLGFAITAMSFPIMIYAQSVLGYSPTKAALLLMPMAVISGVLSPFVGQLVDKFHPALLGGFGLACFSLGLFLYGHMLGATTPVWQLLGASAVLGLGNGFVWSPLTVTATRTLQPRFAGAGSGIFNTTRQMGAVIGSAAVASLMDARLRHHLGPHASSGSAQHAGGHMPEMIAEKFARAMGETMYMPAGLLIISVIAALLFSNPHRRTPKHAASKH